MTPIDLRPFADHSQKVPTKYLAPQKVKVKSSSSKLLTAHFLDFGLVAFFTSFTGAVFQQSIKSLMVTQSLKLAYATTGSMSFTMAFFPVMLFSYFFMSYYMNEGQTWGMHLMKKRMAVKSHDFKEAIKLAHYSFLLCFTGAIIPAIREKVQQSFMSRDYLYEDFMTFKEVAPVDLISLIEDKVPTFEEETKTEEEEFLKAA